MAEYQYVSYGMDDGTILCKSDGKLGFFDATPSVRASCTNAAAVTAGSTTTVCNTGLAELVTELGAKGIISLT